MALGRTVVVGGGAAGMGCALSAARAGADVLLLESDRELGGTIRQAMIHTIAGLFDDEGEILNGGLPMELTERLTRACPFSQKRRIGKTWVLNADPDVYAGVVRNWVSGTPGIEVRCSARVTEVTAEQGRVTALEYHSEGRTQFASLSALADATGSANLVRKIGAGLVEDGCALGGFIVRIRGLRPAALEFPKGAGLLREIRRAAQNGELPGECATAWIDTGVYPDEGYVKFNLRDSDAPLAALGVSAQTCRSDVAQASACSRTSVRQDTARMRAAAERLVEFIRSLDGFESARFERCGEFGIRDGGRIHGEYRLTEADVKAGRRFDDAACSASWPIEHWHPTSGLTLEYLSPGTRYDIPLRSLRVAGFQNLWAPGKCLSAEPRAQASARMAGTCWAMGAAVGAQLAGGSACH